MNTEQIVEKVIEPAKGIPVLILDLVMLIASIVLAGLSVALFAADSALLGAILLILGVAMFIAFSSCLPGSKPCAPTRRWYSRSSAAITAR